MKIAILFLASFLFWQMLVWKEKAQWFENQSKDRYYQIQRLQFKIENMKATPGSLCFFGDSIILLWPTRQYFPGSYNRGISSETTELMLMRFKEDVIDLHPKTVIILGGSNDRDGFTPFHLQEMCEWANLNKIKAYIGTIPPIDGKRQIHHNYWIRDRSDCPIIDFDKALADHPDYFFDRVHPNLAGYEVMSKLVKEELEK